MYIACNYILLPYFNNLYFTYSTFYIMVTNIHNLFFYFFDKYVIINSQIDKNILHWNNTIYDTLRNVVHIILKLFIYIKYLFYRGFFLKRFIRFIIFFLLFWSASQNWLGPIIRKVLLCGLKPHLKILHFPTSISFSYL